ncbi:MAG: MerR family DNA-binding transcriptional regulator [Gammaproteobacteria bacterium]|nr:MerR family DNA-binding transcriptional regulator [Gammaproteobacteria bacterium]
MPDLEYSISDLAQAFSITPRTLRFYEMKGLVLPKRQGVNRIYSDKDKVRLELALRGKRLGFSLEEIKEIIEMQDPTQPDDPRQLFFLLQKLHTKRKELINKFNDINETLNAMDVVEERALAALVKRQPARSVQISLDLT